jgi:hypothetical protein
VKTIPDQMQIIQEKGESERFKGFEVIRDLNKWIYILNVTIGQGNNSNGQSFTVFYLINFNFINWYLNIFHSKT